MPGYDWRPKFVTILATLAMVVGLAGCDPLARSLPPIDPNNHLRIKVVSLSPDGRRLAFDYCTYSRCGIGILDIDSDAIRLIDNPPGSEMIAPSFSDDGTKLVASIGCSCDRDAPEAFDVNIVIVDLSSGAIRPLTRGLGARKYPIFVPNSADVMVVFAPVGRVGDRQFLDSFQQGPAIIDARTGDLRPISRFQGDLQFFILGRPAFVGSDTIVFSGNLFPSSPFPFGPGVSRKNLAPFLSTNYAGFRLKFDRPIELHELTLDPGRQTVGSLSATRDGRRIVFVDDRPNRRPGGRYAQQDVFMLEGGRVEQISDIAGYLHGSHISLDGSRVAVVQNLGRDTDELFLVDVATRQTRHVPLRERLLQSVSRP